jgi:hypothetical protein
MMRDIHVYGVRVSPENQRRILEAHKGFLFRAGDMATWIMENYDDMGLWEPSETKIKEVAQRITDRLLQKMRKAGHSDYGAGKWQIHSLPEHEN